MPAEGAALSLLKARRTFHFASCLLLREPRLSTNQPSSPRIHRGGKAQSALTNGFGEASLANEYTSFHVGNQQVQGDPRVLYALDRILDLPEDDPDSAAASDAATDSDADSSTDGGTSGTGGSGDTAAAASQ